VPQRLKGKFYRIVIRPIMLYGEEYWPVKTSHVQKLRFAVMGMMRWMCDHGKRDKIRNEDIQDKVGVACMVDKMRETRMKWFIDVKTRSEDAPVKRCERLVMAGSRKGCGRPKKYWER